MGEHLCSRCKAAPSRVDKAGYCANCQREYMAEYFRRRQQGLPTVQPPPQRWVCGKCGWSVPWDQRPAHSHCPPCARERSRQWLKDNYEHARAWHRAYAKVKYRELRQAVLEGYGGTPPRCACCGETTHEFLCIDHINGGGNALRAKPSFTHATFYRSLIRAGFPDKDLYQVLCHNCNMAKGFYGQCPHQRLHLRDLKVSILP